MSIQKLGIPIKTQGSIMKKLFSFTVLAVVGCLSAQEGFSNDKDACESCYTTSLNSCSKKKKRGIIEEDLSFQYSEQIAQLFAHKVS